MKLIGINMKRKVKKAPLTTDKKHLQEQMPQMSYPKRIADFSKQKSKSVSLDQVVDRYLIRYEKESIPMSDNIGLDKLPMLETKGSNNVKLLQKFLFEQEDPAAGGGDEPPPDAGGGDTGGGGGGPAEETPVFKTPIINLNDFARSVARLINNFEALTDPKSIILNRAEAYIASNYDTQTAKQFTEMMEQNYGIHPTSTEYPEEYSNPVIYGTTGPNSATSGG